MLKVGYLNEKNYDKYCTADAVLSYKFAQSLSIIPTPPLAGVKVPRQIRTGGIGNGIVNSAISYAQLTGENTQKMVDQFIAEQRTALRLAQPARQILPLAIRNNPNNLLAITYEPTQEDNQFAPPDPTAQPRQPEYLQSIAEPTSNVLANELRSQGREVTDTPRSSRTPDTLERQSLDLFREIAENQAGESEIFDIPEFLTDEYLFDKPISSRTLPSSLDPIMDQLFPSRQTSVALSAYSTADSSGTSGFSRQTSSGTISPPSGSRQSSLQNLSAGSALSKARTEQGITRYAPRGNTSTIDEMLGEEPQKT